jgi:uncharacterized protein HemX
MPPPSAADAAPGRDPSAPPPSPPARDTENSRAAWLAVVLAAVATLLAWFALQRSGDVEVRVDQSRSEAQAREARAAERDRQLDELRRQWTLAQSELDVAAGKVTDADLRRRREALALIDVERVVEQAQLQLRLGAPPAVAIEALAAVDGRLERLSSPAAGRVQTALRHDLARLRALPDLDRGQLAARLDPLLVQVDAWHASADVTHPSFTSAPPGRPVAAEPSADKPPPSGTPGSPSVAPAPAGAKEGERVRAWLAREFGDLVRIREIDTPEALRIGPAQQQLLRDRVRLGVLDLREAIMARDDRTVRAEATALEWMITRYFDPNQPEVAAALTQIRASASAAASGATGSLDETLAALKAARAGNGG